MQTDAASNEKLSISTQSTSANPKMPSTSLLPFLRSVLHPCFTIQSVCSLLPYQSFASPMIKSGWFFVISFRLFATLLRTYSDGSAFSFSKIRRTGDGSFLKLVNACPQGSAGRQPSLASRRTCSFSCSAQAAICAIILASCLIINGLTANSAVEYCVYRSSAAIDKTQWRSS